MDKHFRLILKDEGQDIYMPRQCQSWGVPLRTQYHGAWRHM